MLIHYDITTTSRSLRLVQNFDVQVMQRSNYVDMIYDE